MANISGTNVAAMIAPFTTEDTFPTHDAKYGKGGYRSVDTIAERDAIPAARLTDGCVCYVSADQNEYRYNATTASWTKIEKGGGSSVTVVDNLESTSPTDALSANQGRELGKRTADLEHKVKENPIKDDKNATTSFVDENGNVGLALGKEGAHAKAYNICDKDGNILYTLDAEFCEKVVNLPEEVIGILQSIKGSYPNLHTDGLYITDGKGFLCGGFDKHGIIGRRTFGKTVKIQVFGDSISDTGWGDHKTWVSLAKDYLPCEFDIINSAVEGSQISHRDNATNSMVDVVDSQLRTDNDVVIIFGGTNDWQGSKRIGSIMMSQKIQYLEHLSILFIKYVQRLHLLLFL